MRIFALVIVTSLALWSCGAAEPPTPEPETAAPTTDVATEVELPMVEVAAEGTEFDPPVEVSQLPDGVWYCDMGTVHYASLQPGECPLCGMDLVHKGVAGDAPAGEDLPAESHGGGDAG